MDQYENNNVQNTDSVPVQNNTQPTVSYTPVPQPQQQYSYSSRPQGQPYSYTYQQPQSTHPINNSSPPANNKKSFSFTTLIICIIVCAVLSTVVSSAVTLFLTEPTNNSQSSVDNGNDSGDGGNQTNTTITNNTDNFVEAVAQKVQPSVVGITVSYNSYNFFGNSDSADSSGSGVIYTADGYIITNKHVIDAAINRSGKIKVYLSTNMNKPYDATVVGYDSSTDLAVIKINAKNLPTIEIGKSSDLKVGQNAVAVGNPGGLQFMGSVSVGYISGLNREITIDSVNMTLIQTDTAINPGNSGGALVDNEGKLIGITNAKLVSEDYEGMGFAIPVDTVTEICNGIITGKGSNKPYIGVSINTNYDREYLESRGLPAGAVVASVMTDSPADKAGIKANDIIVAVDGKYIDGYEELVSAIKSHKVGDKMKVKVYRDKKYLDITITVGTNN